MALLTASELVTSVLYFIGGSKRWKDLNDISKTTDSASWLLWSKAAVLSLLILMHLSYSVAEQINATNIKKLKWAKAITEVLFIYILTFAIRIMYKENGRRLSSVWYASMLLYVANIIFAGSILCYFMLYLRATLVSQDIYNLRNLAGYRPCICCRHDCSQLCSCLPVVENTKAEPSSPGKRRQRRAPAELRFVRDRGRRRFREDYGCKCPHLQVRGAVRAD